MIWVRNNTYKHTHTHTHTHTYEVIQTRSKKLRISELKNNERLEELLVFFNNN